ncbi:MAG TPA: lytic transglycosylase domain-containing protein [Candidatus Eremiobacteraceae bacterium]|nr:lytic transglycosylase domain-containing protein [Candidatus Eremiobacteraceae bacterium]
MSILTGIRRAAATLFIIGAAAVAGCSGGGFLPFGEGPHAMDAARLNSIVAVQSRAHDVPPSLVRAVIAQESGGDPSAISTAGAMGLMQLMPGTASAYGVTNPFNPNENIAGGVSYLHDLLQRYHGNVSLALAAYNAGSGAVAKYGGVPPYAETRGYVQSVTALYHAESHSH